MPDDKILRKSKTNIPNIVPTGLITEGIEMLDPNKEYIISLDGKQTGQGLRGMPKGDVDLWGFEGPPTLKDTIKQNEKEINYFNMLALKLMDEDNFCESAVSDLKFALQINTHKIKNLCEAKVCHEILRNTFHSRIQIYPNQGSRNVLVFAEIDAFIAKSNVVIQKLLNMNVEWCEVMAKVNGNFNYFKSESPLNIYDQENAYILLKDDFMDLMYGDTYLEMNPQYVKQRTSKWKKLRESSWITGSTMHDALGLCTLKSQKLHFDTFVSHTTQESHEPNEAMNHGAKHEVNECILNILNISMKFH